MPPVDGPEIATVETVGVGRQNESLSGSKAHAAAPAHQRSASAISNSGDGRETPIDRDDRSAPTDNVASGCGNPFDEEYTLWQIWGGYGQTNSREVSHSGVSV